MNYKAQYNNQRNNAKSRGIDWQFTYDEWIAWWGTDIDNRGRKADSLQMGRKGDTGPYSPDNVKKITCVENQAEAHLGRKNTSETKRKIGEANSKANARPIMTPWGRYESLKIAARELGINRSTLYDRFYYKKDGYEYIDK